LFRPSGVGLLFKGRAGAGEEGEASESGLLVFGEVGVEDGGGGDQGGFPEFLARPPSGGEEVEAAVAAGDLIGSDGATLEAGGYQVSE